MQRLALTLDTPARNLALDEALLDLADEGRLSGGLLRLWESPETIVVLGRSSRCAREVDRDACRRRGIPVLRRSSGGASIVAGPGCLMYSIIVDFQSHPQLRAIDRAHAFVLDRHVRALAERLPGVARRGTSDLAIGERKFSGNSLRAKRRGLLYHGTLLYDFPLGRIARLLRRPPRQPAYRHERDHLDFVRNVPVERSELEALLTRAWRAHAVLPAWPRGAVERLVRDRYACREWTEAF